MVSIILPLALHGQNFVKSYMAYSCWSQKTGSSSCPNLSLIVKFYDDYIQTFNGKFYYSETTPEGNKCYAPLQQGNPALQTIGMIVSKDYSQVREVQQSTMGGMSIQIIYDYSYLGDGAEPAMQATPQYNYGGGYDSYGSGSGGSSSLQCSGCGGTGACTGCGGTGAMKGEYYYTGGGSYVTNCPVCNGTGRCGVCHGSGRL